MSSDFDPQVYGMISTVPLVSLNLLYLTFFQSKQYYFQVMNLIKNIKAFKCLSIAIFRCHWNIEKLDNLIRKLSEVNSLKEIKFHFVDSKIE